MESMGTRVKLRTGRENAMQVANMGRVAHNGIVRFDLNGRTKENRARRDRTKRENEIGIVRAGENR